MRIVSWILLLVLTTGTGTFAGTYPAEPSENSESIEFDDPFAEPENKPIEDPLEKVNRAFFRFNDVVYTRILAPICRSVSPDLRESLAMVKDAFEKPLQIGDKELQFAFRDGGSEVGRFIMHSLLDLLHHFEPASTIGLENGEEDFGKSLQALGFDSGIYLVLPVLGPSSLRDGIGRVTSFYLDPCPRLCNPGGAEAISGERSLISDLQTYEEISRQTLDPYLFIRDAYAQQLASSERKTLLTVSRSSSRDRSIRHSAAAFL